MTHRTLRNITVLSLCALSMVACVNEGVDEGTPEGELLYELSEDELVAIHDAYAPDENIELMRARLTAPFDCSLYDQFCDQVGRDAAYAITGEMIDMAREGAPLEEIEAHFDARVNEAVAQADLAEEQGQETFRASGSWTTQTIGDYRMRVRNGVSTPVVGSRKAWTEAKTQRNGTFGWSNKKATQICVDTGTNNQIYYVHTSSSGTSSTQIESFNPSNSCVTNEATHTSPTYHERNNGGEGNGIQWWYTITARGCATAEINGINFSRCASSFTASF